jgi:transcriptional regulator with XRE-family HTH domain/tetratricopeptide (TPR) repeat protein
VNSGKVLVVVPNERLRRRRLEHGWTLQDVADGLDALAFPELGKPHLGVTAAMVGDWERGKHKPRAPYPRLLCKLFNATAVELGLVWSSGAEESTLEAMQRRSFLQGLGAVTGSAVASVTVEPWARLTAALSQPSRVDRQTVNELEHVTTSLERLESQVSPRALLGPVVGHLATVASLLRGSPRSSLERRLCSIAGETAGLAGWLTWDLDDRRAAGAYFRAGIQAAQEANDKPLGAYLVGSSVVQPAYRERPYARLRRLEGRTHGFTRSDANPSTRAWLVTLEAEAHALAGDERATLQALDEADAAMSRSPEEDITRRPRIAFFDRARLIGERGVALSRLGKSEAAQGVLEDALSSLDPEVVKTRPRLLSALATAQVRQGNIDEACRLGIDALGLAAQQQVGPNLQDVRKLRLELQPWRDSRAVKELDEQLAAVG